MKIGLLLATWASPPNTVTWADRLDLAKASEAVGFDSLWVIDHLLLDTTNAEIRRRTGNAVPVADTVLPQGFLECFSVLAALASTVPRVELGTLVACATYRNPVLLAKMAATIDEISGGRFTLGLGAGDSETEHRRIGAPYSNRVSRFEEVLHIAHALLRTGRIDFEGTYHSVREFELLPAGNRPGGPPLLVGTLKPQRRMQRLVAQYADIWNLWLAFGVGWPESIRPHQSVIQAACEEYGRDPATLTHSASIRVLMPGSVYKMAPGERPLQGPPEVIAEALAGFAREGVEHVHIVLSPNNRESVERFSPVLRLLEESRNVPESV
jgi:alkanesulfonate monooxygenase SsuD/methylene tetrahydromethanopterin reductase-like flavin-dependent oxidoreductase (luciferase family)